MMVFKEAESVEKVFDIAKFDSYKEDNRREVKTAKDGLPGNLWETYSAMANTYGGVIICGVKEHSDGSWFTTGMKDIQKLKRDFWNQINDGNKVSINLLREKDVEACEINGDVILVIHVPVADRTDKPVFINKDMFRGSFKRNNEGDYHCTRAEVQAMVRDQLRKTVDGKIIEDVDVADLNQETIKSYKFLLESKKPEHVFLSLSNEDFLVNIGAARKRGKDKYLPTDKTNPINVYGESKLAGEKAVQKCEKYYTFSFYYRPIYLYKISFIVFYCL